MKIDLTPDEIAQILVRETVKKLAPCEEGKFNVKWTLAAATGQPAVFVGASVELDVR